MVWYQEVLLLLSSLRRKKCSQIKAEMWTGGGNRWVFVNPYIQLTVFPVQNKGRQSDISIYWVQRIFRVT